MGQSVTSRIKSAKQPWGGYLRPRDMAVESDSFELYYSIDEEKVAPSIVGMGTDYLTRLFLFPGKPEVAFAISSVGAKIAKEEPAFGRLLEEVRSLAAPLTKPGGTIPYDDAVSLARLSLIISTFDVYYRSPLSARYPWTEIEPGVEASENAFQMAAWSADKLRLAAAGHDYPDTLITFNGGYTDLISDGDADYLAGGTLWDMKVSTRPPTSKDTLQLLVYWRMALHSEEGYGDIHSVGILNPRLWSVYTYELSNLPEDTVRILDKEIIGY